MRILVAYASKTGVTEKAARQLADQLTQLGATVELCALPNVVSALSSYDGYAVGGSIRIGMLHKLAKAFISSQKNLLMQKPVGFFCCRCGTDDTRALLTPQLGTELSAHAVEIASFGGEMELSKQKGFDRFVAKIVSKSDKGGAMHADGILTQRINDFAAALFAAIQA